MNTKLTDGVNLPNVYEKYANTINSDKVVEVKGKISSLLELGAAFNPELTGVENIYQHGQVMGLSNEEIKEIKEKEGKRLW